MNKISKCLKCLNFFSKTKTMKHNDIEEIESKCLVSGDDISSSSIVSECTHFKEKSIKEKIN